MLIAVELRRCGAPVFLLAEGVAMEEFFANGRGALSFTASTDWPSQGPAASAVESVTRIYCGDGICNSSVVLERIGPALPVSAVPLWGQEDSSEVIEIALWSTRISGNLSIVSPTKSIPSLDLAFYRLIGRITETAWGRARAIVEQSGASEAHVCDHLFFGSSLIAHAVRQKGGKVVVWPHSTNAVHVAVREPGFVSSVTTMTRSAAQAWRAKLPADSIFVDSGLTLPTPAATPKGPADSRVHIIVFAGAHRLLRMPLVPSGAHRAAWRDLFRGLDSLPEDFEIFLKPKTTWEPIEWLDQFRRPGCRTRVTSTVAAKLDYPNMVFVSVSLGTSALLEGLERGIPCMIVRPFEVEDYTAIDPSYFPVGNVETIISSLRRCREPEFRAQLVREQLEWYSRETSYVANERKVGRWARFQLRVARLSDAEKLFRWRNDPATRAASHSSAELRWDEHLRWLDETLLNQDRQLLVAEDDTGPVGTIRLDREDRVWVLSWTVAPDRRGSGIGSEIVAAIVDIATEPLRAEIKIDNVASRRIAEKAGMTLIGASDRTLVYYIEKGLL